MSDYLSHIAAKSLDLNAEIQPRLTGLFEPVTSSEVLPDLSSELEHSPTGWPSPNKIAEPPSPIPPSAPTLLSPTAPIPPVSPAPSLAFSPTQLPPLQPKVDSPPPPSVPTTRPEPPVSDPMPRASRFLLSGSQTSRPGGTTGIRPAQPPMASQSPHCFGNESHEMVSPPGETPIRPAVVQITPPAATPSQLEPRPQPQAPLPTVHPTPSQVVPRLESQGLPPPPSPPTPPPIQVTIGRIDVRAIAPTQPPPKPPKSRPTKPSLEEYLRSRSGSRAFRNGGR